MSTITIRTAPNLQTRTSEGIDLPIAGRWQLHRASFVGLTQDRRRHDKLHLRDGWIDVSDRVDDPLTLVLRTDAHAPPRVVAWATAITTDATRFARWPLLGEINDNGTAPRVLHGELAFQGVYRRAGQQWAWITGWASTHESGRRRTSGHVALVFDLIAHPPSH